MHRSCFHADELVLMAKVLGKHHILGVPDVSALLPESEKLEKELDSLERLLKERVLTFSENNNLTVSEAYHDLIETCCGSRCMMVMMSKPEQKTVQRLWWPHQEQFLTAEVSDGVFQFREGSLPALELLAMLEEMQLSRTIRTPIAQFEIPNIILRKARRDTEQNNPDKAIGALRKGGAKEKEAAEIVAAFQGRRQFFCLSTAQSSGEGTNVNTMSFLTGEFGTWTLEPHVVNLRSCIKFRQDGNAEHRVKTAIQQFVSGDDMA